MNTKLTCCSIGLFFLVFAVYLFSIPPSLAPYRDSGEMAAVSNQLGIAHPPGYPLYVILGKIAGILIFIGDEAYRLAVSSALCSAGAVVVLFLLAYYLAGVYFSNLSLIGRLCASSLGAVLFAFSDKLWYSAQVQEMYSLNILLVMLVMLVFTVFAHNKGDYRLFYVGMLVFGAALTNRSDAVLIAGFIAVVYFYAAGKKVFENKSKAFYGLMFFAAGLLLYGYLLARSKTAPYMNWNSPDTIEKLISTISRKSHGHTLDLLSSNYANGELFFEGMWVYIKQLAVEFTLLGLPLGAAGIIFFYRKNKLLAAAVLAAFITAGPLFIYLANMPPNPHALAVLEAHFLLPNAVFAIFVSVGILGLTAALQKKYYPIVAVIAAACCLSVISNPARMEMRQNYFAYDYFKNLSRCVAGDSIVVIKEDVQLFSCWYYSTVKKLKSDTVFLAKGLSGSRWYAETLKKYHGIFSGPLNNDAQWSDFASLNKPKKIYFTVDVPLDGGFSLPSTSSGLARELYGPPQAKAGDALLYEMCYFRVGYNYETQRNFFNADLIEDYAKSYSVHAAGLLALNRFAEALRAYFFSASLKGDSPETYSAIGYCYLAMEDNLNAYKHYLIADFYYRYTLESARKYRTLKNVVEAIKKDYAATLVNLGVLNERLGSPEKAKSNYQESIAQDPSGLQAYYNLGVLYWHENNWPMVVRYFSKVTESDPGFLSAERYLNQAKIRLN